MAFMEEQFEKACKDGELPGVALLACNASGMSPVTRHEIVYPLIKLIERA